MGNASSINHISSFVANDLTAMKKGLKTVYPSGTHKWQPRLSVSIFFIVFDWFVICSSVALVAFVSIYFLPVTLIAIGSRQRALSNIVHEAAHFNLMRKKRLNDFLSDTLAALPMFDTTRMYRSGHIQHHINLGVKEIDPDLASHLRYGFDDHAPPLDQPLQTYASLVCNRQSWRDSVLGGLQKINSSEKVQVATWWVATTFVSYVTLGLNFTIAFILLWAAARMTTYHLIRIFAEFLDHTGLQPGSIIGFSRTISKAGFLGKIFHPHSDNYHLVHHLMPGVPHYYLKSAHESLIKVPLYARAHHCTGYFSGEHSAIACWSGICKGGIK